MFNRFWLQCTNSPASNKLEVLGCFSVLRTIHPNNPIQFDFSGTRFGLSPFSSFKNHVGRVY